MTWATGGDFSGQTLRNVDFSNARIIGSLTGARIEGEVGGLTINGVEVWPLVERELARLHPERKDLFATTPEGMKQSYDVIFGQIDATIERARRLTEEQRQQRVDDEWSTTETIRHLIFAVDAWILRTVLGDPAPYHPIGLPFTEMTPTPAVTCDPDAHPSFEETVEVWQERSVRTIRDLIGRLSAEGLEKPVTTSGDGYPPAGVETQVIGPLWTILEESWWHNRFMNRDLDVIEGVTS